MNANTWDTLIGYAIAFALGVALTILILGE
jgi:ABC-type nitrate/sulfonate/bicarbonate transport system permease component